MTLRVLLLGVGCEAVKINMGSVVAGLLIKQIQLVSIL